MSAAKPMPLGDRLYNYLRAPVQDHHETDLTPAQRRRAWHKAHRSGERGTDSEVLYGRKGHATPRQRKPRRDG
jgi:hypothetical protein